MGTWNVEGTDYSETLDLLIVALCRDYTRRRDMISDKKCSKRTAMEYKYINHSLLSAAVEIVGPSAAEIYINEIGNKTGYAKTVLEFTSEGTYKKNKSEIRRNIAKKLHLLD